MGIEIERKFLVTSDGWRAAAGEGARLRQGYLAALPGCTVRVRLAAGRGFLTVKGASSGLARPEFEYEIPEADAVEMLERLCWRPLIEKTRYRIPVGAFTWEVDVFDGENAGLVVAEVELSASDTPVDLPAWVGREVSGDPRYHNANLARNPYARWRHEA